MNHGMVIIIGMGVVFVGLFLLILAITILNGVLSAFEKKTPQNVHETVSDNQVLSDIEHNTLVAIIASAIATETNTDAEGLRIKSIKRV